MPKTLARTIALLAAKSVPQPNGCILWDGHLDRAGYGVIMTYRANGTRKASRAHRVAWEVTNGDIPDGLTLDHTCHNRDAEVDLCDGGKTCLHRRCINIEHLEPTTHLENIARSPVMRRRQALRTHCKKGHEYTSENTYINPTSGQRACRTCMGASAARRTDRLSIICPTCSAAVFDLEKHANWHLRVVQQIAARHADPLAEPPGCERAS